MCRSPQETADLVTFTEEFLNGNLHFLCSVKAKFVRNTCVKHLILKVNDLVLSN